MSDDLADARRERVMRKALDDLTQARRMIAGGLDLMIDSVATIVADSASAGREAAWAPSRPLTLAEAAEYIGISQRSFYALVKRGIIPRLERESGQGARARPRFSRESLDAYNRGEPAARRAPRGRSA